MQETNCGGVLVIRWLTAGESHGPALSAILEGMPAHIEITKEMIDADLKISRLMLFQSLVAYDMVNLKAVQSRCRLVIPNGLSGKKLCRRRKLMSKS